MRCLILGATGLVGSQLAAACDDRDWSHLGTYYRRPHPEYAPLDLRDDEAVADLIGDYQPDVTFLTAGVTAAAFAEADPDECHAVNVGGVTTVARAVADAGGTLAFLSSAQVFGDCRSARREDDPVAPAGVFARTQVLAEEVVRLTLPDRHLVVRTSGVFGPHEFGRDFLSTCLRRLGRGETVAVADDLYLQPTYGPDLADAVLELVKLGHTGTVHVTGPERITAFALARLAAFVFGCDADALEPAAAADLGVPPAVAVSPWLDRYESRTLLGANAVRRPAEGLRAMRDRVAAPLTPARAA